MQREAIDALPHLGRATGYITAVIRLLSLGSRGTIIAIARLRGKPMHVLNIGEQIRLSEKNDACDSHTKGCSFFIFILALCIDLYQ